MNVLRVSYSQVALRIHPLSEAELEEGATIIAHKVGDQVSEREDTCPWQRGCEALLQCMLSSFTTCSDMGRARMMPPTPLLWCRRA